MSSMQWTPGPDPQGASTDRIRATPGWLATNAAPVTPGTRAGTSSGRGVSGPVTRIPPLSVASSTSTSVPWYTHSVLPLSELVMIMPMLVHWLSGEAVAGGAAAVACGVVVTSV